MELMRVATFASIDQMVNQTLGRVLDLFAIKTDVVSRWEGLTPSKSRDQ